jgi:uncharacterized protein (TIGR02996 family)
VATNPQLEAAIEKDPDDEEAYLVYGDWLQTEDDPRGELIALQAAANRDPSDKQLVRRITELLARHDEVLLGELGGEMSVTWHLGFVRTVRLAADKDPAKPIASLRALLEHPSGRFVRSISFAQPKGIDPKAVVKLLVDGKRPATLSELRIGGNWDVEEDAPELRTVFPRLHRSLDVEWRRILKLLSEQRAVDLKYDASKLPPLVALPDVQADGVAPEHILLGLRLEIDKRKDVGMVAALRRSFTPESLDKLAVALGEQFLDAGAPTNMRWGFQALGRIGGDAAVAWIASYLGEWSHARAVQGAEILGQLRSAAAIWELHAMVTSTSLNRPRREDAAQVLARVASERAMDIDRMLDRAVVAGSASSRVRDAMIRRLEAHMIDGRRIPHREFLHYLVRPPVLAPLVRRVLWATYDGVDVETTFRIDGDGNALDAGGDAVDLDGAMIGALHPAELAADDRRGILKEWGEVFDDEDIVPLFPQLERPVHELRDTDQGVAITRFKLRKIGFDLLRTLEDTFDWEPELEEMDGGGPLTVAWSKLFRRDNVLANAVIDGGTIGQVTVTRSGKQVAFKSIHPVTASEIIHAIDRATTREKPEAIDAAMAPGGKIVKGMRVKIHSGANRLREGTVFWLGDGNKGPRCGIKTDEDETLWADVADVRPTAVVDTGRKDVEDDETDDAAGDEADKFIAAATKQKPAAAKRKVIAPEPAKPSSLEKGTKVRWSKGRLSGTGTVFWLGQNKFGDGMRAGVKDDETGETVWADADDCKPV